MDFLVTSTHLHITTWVVALILFFVAAFSKKKLTAVHMILRVVYILIIVTGVALYMEYMSAYSMMYHIKALCGILVIGLMEMILVGKNKGKSLKGLWIAFAIVFFITISIGFSVGL